MLFVRSWRALLAVLAAVAGTLATVAAPQLALAASDQEQTVAQTALTPELPAALSFSNGFARLAAADSDFIGDPLSVELPGDEEGSTIQKTTTGVLLYWQGPGHPAAATDGFSRAALVDGRGLVTWTGDALDPPPPPAPVAFVPAVAQPVAAVASGPGAAGAYILAHSGWDAWHVACGESHLGLAMWNPRPWPPGASTHAAGYFGWLPGTAASVGVRIGDLASEVSGFNRMVATGRRGEFAGWRSDCPAP